MSHILKYTRLKGYKLNKKDLDELGACIAEGITNKSAITFSLTSGNRHITKEGLDELSADSSIPSILHDLSIICSAILAPLYEYRSATVHFSSGRASLEVVGNDEIWVEGKSEQIKNFLRLRQVSWRYFLAKFGGIIVWAVMAACSIVVFAFVNKWAGIGTMGLAVIIPILSIACEKCNVPLNVIYLRHVKESWFKRNASTLVAAAVGAIIGAVVMFGLTKLFP